MDDVGHFVPHFTVPGTWENVGVWQVWTLGMTGFLQSVTASCTFTFMPNIADPGFIAMSDKAPLSSAAKKCGRLLADVWNMLEYFVEDHTTIFSLDKMPGHEEFLVSLLWVTQRRSGIWGSVKELTLWQCPQVTSSSWRTVSLACCWLSSNLPVRSRIQPVALVSHHQPKLRMGTYYII